LRNLWMRELNSIFCHIKLKNGNLTGITSTRVMKMKIYSAYERGRLLLGRLSHGRDIIPAVEHFCRDMSIQMATFSIIGAVSSVTLGGYDQKQQVYVTYREEGPFEIASCSGSVSLKDGQPFIQANMIIWDERGKIICGHLFSETIIFAGEVELQELIGNPLKREFDTTTGLFLWKSEPD